MADDRCGTAPRGQGGSTNPLSEQGGNECFRDIDDQGRAAGFQPGNAKHVGCARISRPFAGRIMANDPANQECRREGAQKKRTNHKEPIEIHCR